MTKIAKVIDIAPAHLRRALRSSSAEQAVATIIDDIADGIEAIHQLSNLAGFSERPRAFIFALASAAHKAGDSFVELYDDELAAQQGCSTRTVRRQRADYLKESRAKRFGFVEVIEGDYNQGTNQNAPTRYRFHVGGQIAEAVVLARQTEDWTELSRAQQRKVISRACEDVFQTIPDARRQKRKGRRLRLATSEIETCMKVIETTWAKMQERVEKLPAYDHDQLMEDPGELRDRILKMREKLDEFLEISTAQSVETDEDGRGVRTNCPHPPVSAPPVASGEPVRVSEYIKNTRTLSPPALEPIEHTPEAISLFENICDRLTVPKVQTAEIELKAPPPAEGLDLDTLAERAAILEYDGAVERAEAEARAGEVLRE
jgi:hypothetical protein